MSYNKIYMINNNKKNIFKINMMKFIKKYKLKQK